MPRRRRNNKGFGLKPAERLLIERIPVPDVPRIACTSLGRAQLAAHLAAERPQCHITCLYFDRYLARRAFQAREPLPDNLRIVCDTDFPEETFDAVFLPLPKTGERELARDLMQSAVLCLEDGGTLFVAGERPKNTWLHDEMRTLFPKVTQIEFESATILSAVRKGPPKRIRDFSSEFAFRDQEQLIKVVSRPGVFSHRQLDLGARTLIDAMEVQPGDRVLDIGCGSGVVAFAAAARAGQGTVTAVDSNARAVQCTRIGAELNGFTNIEALLDEDVSQPDRFAYDCALANPPYYSHYKIAELFLEGAHRCLKPGGRLYLVTKKADWYLRTMPDLFHNVNLIADRQFKVITARQP